MFNFTWTLRNGHWDLFCHKNWKQMFFVCVCVCMIVCEYVNAESEFQLKFTHISLKSFSKCKQLY